MRLAARRPDLVHSCTLLNTSAGAEPAENVPGYRTLNRVAKWLGLRIVANKVMPIMFGRTFLTNPARIVERDLWRERLSSNCREIMRAVNDVIERASIMPELRHITMPTLILVGGEDMATVPRHAEQIHAAISGSELVRIPRAGHSSSIEESVHVTVAIEAWIGRAEHA